MGRLNSNQICTAISQISGSLDIDTCTRSSNEQLRRNRRSRKMSSPAKESRNAPLALGEQFYRVDTCKRSGVSCAATSNTSGSQSPGHLCAYAGAKFGDAPSPRLLPPPPKHWLNSSNLQQSSLLGSCVSLTSEIKTILQVA